MIRTADTLTFLLANEEATAAAWEYRDAVLDAILDLDARLAELGVPSYERADVRRELRLALLAG